MSNDLAALALVVDRSGSMHSVRSDTVGSVEQFIASQKEKEGKAFLTLVQFDHEYDVVHDFVDITKVDEKKFAKEYSPRGMTALLDAIGRTTIELGKKLDDMDEADRPKRVVVAIITDGYENASKEFDIAKIKEMITEKETKHGWDFLFLGATLDTMNIAKTYGFAPCKTAYYSARNVERAVKTMDDQVTKARQGEKVAIDEAEREELAKGVCGGCCGG